MAEQLGKGNGANFMINNCFSDWLIWDSRNRISDVTSPGIYVLAISETNIEGQQFSWIKDIVYIGMTNSKGGLKSRLKQFDNTIKGKRGHGGADRFRYIYEDYELLINNLFVSAMPLTCDVSSNHPDDLLRMGEIARLEYVCFAEYARNYGYLPKFNDKKNSPKYSLTKGRK